MLFRAAALSALCLAAAAGRLAAADTVAVLTSASGVYMEAFSAFRKEYGGDIGFLDVSKRKPVIPPGTRTVVAFGAGAAGHRYPPGVDLVYALAPGFLADTRGRTGATVKISMLDEPERFLSRLKNLQPSLKKLRVFWRAPGYADLPLEYPAAGLKAGIEVSVVKVDREEQLPGLLRETLGRADAFWLPPDPLLISEWSLPVFRKFSHANAIPMYASTKGLAAKGACASIGASYASIGAAAAAAAKSLAEGGTVPAVVHPDSDQLALNSTAARYCGIVFSAETVRRADHRFP